MALPLHNFTIHVDADWNLTFTQPTIDSVAVDMTDSAWGGWVLQIKKSIDYQPVKLSVTETANTNGSQFVTGATSSAMTVVEEDLDEIGPGTWHYNVLFTYSGTTYLALHGNLVVKG